MQSNKEYCDEVTLLDYMKVIRKRGKLIFIIAAVTVLTTVTFSLLSTEIYQSRAVIMPADQKSGDQQGMSSIAAQFGISSPATTNISEIISLLKSNILMERVIKRNDLLPVFFDGKKLKETPDDVRIWQGIRRIKEIFNVSNNLKDGVIELSVEFTDPKNSAKILQYILDELTEYMSSEARRVAVTNREYLESLIDRNADPLIRQKIYSLIAKQIEISMMAEVKENFAFKIIDPPKAPDMRIRPKIRQNAMLSLFGSLLAGIFAAFALEYFESAGWRKNRAAAKGRGTAEGLYEVKHIAEREDVDAT